jgi:murein DD-endopeptidase MepM/ murein hydrolase activator NlpD
MIFSAYQKKKRKLYTLLLLGPHGRPFKLQIPKYALYLLLAFSLVGVITLTALAKSYARMLLKVSNYNYLRADREALKTQYHLLESAVKHTNTQLSSLESLASEVAVSYGFAKTSPSQLAHMTSTGISQSSSTSDARYNASLYAFNLIEQASMISSRNPSLLGLLSSPVVNPGEIPSIWPVQGEVTAGFGERMDPFSGEGAFHSGMDIAAPSGTPVRAAADGIVLHAGPGEAGYGNEILIDHGSGMATKYGHLRRIFVIEGQEVRKGQIIGSVGMTGRATGPHLHYEVLVHETPVNPAKFLRG